MTTFPEGRVVIEDLDQGSSHFQTNETGSVTVIEVNTLASMGDPGPQGDPGEGVPTGGTTGQVLVKDSGTNYDTSWATRYAVPAGGNAEQVLAKASGTDGDTEWVNAPSATSPVFVYDSSALQTGNTYADWADLMTAVDGIDGPKIIQFQQDETIPTTGMPVAGWDLNDATLAGHGDGTDSAHLITFPNGCKIQNPGYPFAAAGIALYSTSSSSVLTVSTATTIVLVDDALVLSKSAAFINVATTSGRVVVSLRNGSGLVLPSETTQFGIEAAGDYESVNVTGTLDAFNVVDTSGSTYLSDDVVRGGTGVTMLRVIMSPADPTGLHLGDTQTNADNWTVVRAAKGERIGYDGDGTAFDVYTGVVDVAGALDAIGGYVPAPGATGNLMTSDGTDWTSAAPADTFGSLAVSLEAGTPSGSWAIASSALYFATGAVQNEYVDFASLPLGGTYTILVTVRRTTTGGQLQLSVDGNNVGSVLDTYNGSTDYITLSVTGVSITDGLHTLRVSVPSKNGSSSSYACNIVSIGFRRTA